MYSTALFLIISGVENNRVNIVALLELESKQYCNDSTGLPEFALSMGLATQFVIDQLNSTLSDLAVAGVQYGRLTGAMYQLMAQLISKLY